MGSGVGQPQGMLMHEFGRVISDAFGTDNVYHVGSSLHSDKVSWRDVDVRVLLDNDQWNSLFGDLRPIDNHHSPKWRMLCIVFSHYGRHMTGLPIDFQIQRITEANIEYHGNRSHLGIHNL